MEKKGKARGNKSVMSNARHGGAGAQHLILNIADIRGDIPRIRARRPTWLTS